MKLKELPRIDEFGKFEHLSSIEKSKNKRVQRPTMRICSYRLIGGTSYTRAVRRYEIPDPRLESSPMNKMVKLKNRSSQIIE